MKHKKEIVVTGASGFIGLSLCGHLLRMGHSVTAVVRSKSQSLPPEVSQVLLDLSKAPLPAGLIDRNVIVIHLAAQIRDNPKGQPSAETTNLKIAEHLIASNPKRLIVLSSVAASMAEQDAAKASQYGKTKSQIDQLFKDALPNCTTITLRPPAVYGTGMHGPITTLARLVRKGWPLPLGLADQKRPYLSINNLTDLIACIAVQNPKNWGNLSNRPIDIHDGKLASTRQLISFLASEQSVRLRNLPIPLFILRIFGFVLNKRALVSAAIDPVSCDMPTSLLTSIGWEPKEQMPESLKFLSDR